MFIFSTFSDGVIEGKDAHWITFFGLFPMPEIFFNIDRRLCIIRTDLPEDFI